MKNEKAGKSDQLCRLMHGGIDGDLDLFATAQPHQAQEAGTQKQSCSRQGNGGSSKRSIVITAIRTNT